MPEKKTDRRTLKTRKSICDAFAELLAEKELHKVTVQEIADKADVNRVTFYKHYLDVYDLYDKIEEDVLVELGLLMLQLGELRSEEFFSHLIGYISENKSIFKMIFSPNGTSRLREKFGKIMEGLFRQLLTEQQDLDLNDSRTIFQSCYRTQGCIAVIEKWVRNDLAEPKEFIIKTISELDKNTEKLITKK
ncbi:MAG: TetR/AcrR family transcriptional regulator [Ruminococcus sp.]|nr:TetR/AcrR family transcriptional regulator [Ruminococcus sp.]